MSYLSLSVYPHLDEFLQVEADALQSFLQTIEIERLLTSSIHNDQLTNYKHQVESLLHQKNSIAEDLRRALKEKDDLVRENANLKDRKQETAPIPQSICQSVDTSLIDQDTNTHHIFKLNASKLKAENRIGRGSSGEVYKASLTFAVKKLTHGREKLGIGQGSTLEADLDLALRLDHPNVLTVYGHGFSNDEHLYMFLELKDFSLDRLLQPEVHSLFSKGHFASMCLQVLEGLRYLHEMGVIHGDVNAQNVLVEEMPNGLSVVLSSSCTSMTTLLEGEELNDVSVGTLVYTAPEVIRGIKSRKSDIYSFGLLVWELFTGSTVKLSESMVQTMYMLSNQTELETHLKLLLKMLAGDDPMQEFLPKCCCFDRNARLSADEAITHMRAVTEKYGPPSSVAVPSPFSEARKPITTFLNRGRDVVYAANVDPVYADDASESEGN